MTTHGTTGGYQGHVKRKDEICDACRKAQMEYLAGWRERAGDDLKRRQKRRAAARSRALSQLAARHQEEYLELRLAELQKIPQ
jgi:hypothetical protein